MRRRSILRGSAAIVAALLAREAAAQRDSVVVAGERYRADRVQRAVLGDGYRDVWAARERVPFLELATFGGGLTPTERGGGNQTRSLRFRSADGREFAFRSVDKDPVTPLGPDVVGTFAGAVLQDLVSAQHPSGQLAVTVLQDALGILHPPPTLYVMPDDPRLGEFRAEFAGMLGYLEERPAAGTTHIPGLRRAAAIEGTDEFLEALAGGDRLDEEAYLTSRLLDLVIGDWDRHEDQYRWARFDQDGARVWRPVPRDRDYSFADYQGLGVAAARHVFPKAVAFGPDPTPELFGLIQNAQRLDRRLLGGLSRDRWQAVTDRVVAGLSDAVISTAIGRLPPEHRAASGEFLAARLRERRDRLPEAAALFYAWLSEEPNLYGREAGDEAVLERRPDGALEVRIAVAGSGEPFLARRFTPAETREVRLYLLGGNDRAVVRGAGPGRVGVRVIGGPGDDVMMDSSARGATRFYDQEGDDVFGRRRGTTVDRRAYSEAEWTHERGVLPPREWGRHASLLTPGFGWRSRVGPMVSIGPSWTDYGFRRHPFEDHGKLRLVFAPLDSRVGVEYSGEYHFTGDRRWLEVDVRATGLSASDFYGYGNQTPRLQERGEHRFFEKRFLVEPTWHFPLSRRSWLSLGPTLEWRDAEPEPTSVAARLDVPGASEWGALGARAGVAIDRRDRAAFPRRGWTFALSGSAFPAVRDLPGAFAGASADAQAYLSAGAGPVLALRAGGRGAWGDFPLQHAAFAGGRTTLRGHAGDRFAGDAAAFGSAELRQPLFRANLLVRGTLGVLALADAGRVWVDGDSPGGWHTAAGGGVYFNFLNGSRSASLYFAHGEQTRAYAQMGVPF